MATRRGAGYGMRGRQSECGAAGVRVALQYSKGERGVSANKISDFQAYIQQQLAKTCRWRSAPPVCFQHKAAWGCRIKVSRNTEAGAKAKLFASETARRQTARRFQGLGWLWLYDGAFPRRALITVTRSITEIYEERARSRVS